MAVFQVTLYNILRKWVALLGGGGERRGGVGRFDSLILMISGR